MLPLSALTTVLPTLPVQPFTGVLYRAVTLESLFGFHRNPPYPSIRPLYNLGAPNTGARFTPQGGMPSLYLAEDTDTAIAEVNQVYAKLRQQNPPAMAPIAPCVLFSVHVFLGRVLNLETSAIQRALQTNTTELCAAWRPTQASGNLPLTQQLGQAAFQSGQIQALQYPSAQLASHSCFVIFPDRLTGPAFVEVYDPDGNLQERLP